MKKALLFGLLVALMLPLPAFVHSAPALAGVTAPATAGPTKHALIVAIANYAPGTGWMPISSDRDVELIRAALLQQAFSNDRIQVLTDAKATKAGIVAELRALAGRVQAGDVVVFHFSGHGQQVMDDNKDETDGYDEALVPYDAPAHYASPDNTGQHHLRDDELGALLAEIRGKLGPQGDLLVLLDACHSGTATRGGFANVRGTRDALAPASYNPGDACKQGCSFGLADEGTPAATHAPMTCYFACGAHQLNSEAFDDQQRGVGSLSYAFAKAVNSFSTSPSYATLFEHIRTEMAATVPQQSPQMEGNGRGQVFGGKLLETAEHFGTLDWKSDKLLSVNGGTLHGLYPGSRVALYAPDTDPTTTPKPTPLTTGKLVTCSLASSTVELDAPLAGHRDAWAFVTSRRLPLVEMRMRVDLKNKGLQKQLLDSVKVRPFVKVITDGPADMVLEQNNRFTNGDNVQLTLNQGAVVYRVASSGVKVDALLEVLARVAQVKQIRELKNAAPEVRMTVELVPVLVSGPATSANLRAARASWPPNRNATLFTTSFLKTAPSCGSG